MAASKKANKNTINKSKTVGKAITRPSSNRLSHNGRYVAATSSIRDTRSEPIEELSPGYRQHVRALIGQALEDERDERPNEYRVHKSYTRHHHRHHHSSESNSDSEEGDGRTKSSRVSKAETRSHRAAELGCDPPESWYSQTDLSREAARYLWWGLDPETQKTYAAVGESYGAHCVIQGIKPGFPATIYSLATWITDLYNKRVKIEMIKTHLTSLRSLHVGIGHEDLAAFDSPTIKRILAGIRRLREYSLVHGADSVPQL